MRTVVYSAGFVFIALTTFLLLSFEQLGINENMSVFLNRLSIDTADSVSVFSTNTLRLVSSPQNGLSGIVFLKLDGNRLSNDDSIFLLKKTPVIFKMNYSFADTGIRTVNCYVVLSNGSYKKLSKSIYVYSPLKAAMQVNEYDSIVLSTAEVSDPVNYVWEFDNGLIVYNTNPQVVLPKENGKCLSGKLYVECAHDRSPEIRFSFELNKRSNPVLAFKR